LHPVLTSESVAVVTGAAGGIGLAAATAFAGLGMRVCIADLAADRLSAAADVLASVAPNGTASIMSMTTDVSRIDDVVRLEAAVRERFGGTDVLMNNAGVQPGSAMFGPRDNWQTISASIYGASSTAPRRSFPA
jgi:hypothetical protein